MICLTFRKMKNFAFRTLASNFILYPLVFIFIVLSSPAASPPLYVTCHLPFKMYLVVSNVQFIKTTTINYDAFAITKTKGIVDALDKNIFVAN